MTEVRKLALWPLNTLFFVIGMTGLWITTHDWRVMAFGWVASLHFVYRGRDYIPLARETEAGTD